MQARRPLIFFVLLLIGLLVWMVWPTLPPLSPDSMAELAHFCARAYGGRPVAKGCMVQDKLVDWREVHREMRR